VKKSILISIVAISFAVSCDNITTERSLPAADSAKAKTTAKNKTTIKIDTVAAKDTSGKNKNETYNLVKRNYHKEGYYEATVKDFTGLDGCSFLLILLDGRKLEPNNLNKDFKQDGIKVWVKFVPANFTSICMAGETVSIVAMEKDTR